MPLLRQIGLVGLTGDDKNDEGDDCSPARNLAGVKKRSIAERLWIVGG